MSKLRPILLLSIWIVRPVSLWPHEDRTLWHLADVLKAATEKVDQDDTSLTSARLELEMLQALNKTRIELRPQLNILSFSNPLFLAASLGGSLSINRRTAPSPVNLALARLGVVQAEVRHLSNRLTAQIEATHQFFALAEAQELEQANCAAWAEQNAGREKVKQLAAFKRITNLDVARFEQDTIGLESACLDAQGQAQAAALALVRITGANLAADQIAVSTDDLIQVSTSSKLPAVDDLVSLALNSREDLKAVSEHLAQLTVRRKKFRPQFDSVSVGYGYLETPIKGGLDAKELLGGNTGHLDGGFYLPLRNTGVDAATSTFLQARFNEIQRELENMKIALRREVEANVQRSSLASARLKIASKKAALAKELHTLTTIRENEGLQSESDELWARREWANTAAEAKRVEFDWKESTLTVLALCEPEKVAVGTQGRPDQAILETPNITRLLADDDETVGMDLKSIDSNLRAASSPVAASTSAPTDARTTAQIQGAPARAIPDVMEYVPPHVIKQKLVTESGGKGSLVVRETSVPVQVKIDEFGHVREAIVLKNDNPFSGTNPILCSRAMDAAKEWTFEPARMHGKAIPSLYTIEFKFLP
jgi:hypothetical protein